MNPTNKWAKEQFGSIWFGDPRLTRRTVMIAAQMSRRPGDSPGNGDESHREAACRGEMGVCRENSLIGGSRGAPAVNIASLGGCCCLPSRLNSSMEEGGQPSRRSIRSRCG
ncbi:transposase [bacterium]|nr:transposase [bacterium]